MRRVVTFVVAVGLTPNLQLVASDVAKSVRLTGSIENEGDAPAAKVAIESVRTNKVVAQVETLQSGDEQDLTLDIPESDLGIGKDGGYVIPMRLISDKQSSAFVLTYYKKSDPNSSSKTSPVSVGLDEETKKLGTVFVAGSGELELLLANTSRSPIELSLEFVGAKDLEFKTETPKITLGPQEEKRLTVAIKNLNGTPNARYASYAVVTGTLDGSVYSEYIGFVVNVSGTTKSSWMPYAFGFLAIAFAWIGLVYWRKETASTEGPQA